MTDIEILSGETGVTVNELEYKNEVQVIRPSEALTAMQQAREDERSKINEEMHLNMQYYMEYCQMNGYVTPMDWIEKHEHF